MLYCKKEALFLIPVAPTHSNAQYSKVENSHSVAPSPSNLCFSFVSQRSELLGRCTAGLTVNLRLPALNQTPSVVTPHDLPPADAVVLFILTHSKIYCVNFSADTKAQQRLPDARPSARAAICMLAGYT